MINIATLKEALANYKKDFVAKVWGEEKYKWQAVQHFQEHWDIDAVDFPEMFRQATDKTGNLLASSHNYPRAMIQKFAQADPEATKSMFLSLYDESKDLTSRVEEFIAEANAIREKYSDGTWHNHWQDANSVSTYLWLRYPDQYYIYKYSECRAVAQALDSDFVPKKGAGTINLVRGFELYNRICDELSQDEGLATLLHSVLDASCYPDPALKTLTIDVCFYISRVHSEKSKGSNRKYWWLVASPDRWSLSRLAVGDTQDYALYNADKSKRKYFRNLHDAKAGDLVVGYESSPVKKVIALGEITDNDGTRVHFRKTEDLHNPIAYATITSDPDLAGMECLPANMQASLFKLTKNEYDHLIDLIRAENPLPIKNGVKSYSKECFLSEVYMAENDFDTLVSLLKRKQNLILEGPPGVGKTFAATRLAYAMMGEKRHSNIEFVQFHQNYSYEDFVMGYKPGEKRFELEYGVFYNFCKKADGKGEPFFFIIDEINRGNMSKIFGELLMLIEKDYRGTEATLAYNKTPFSVPKNVYIIGMMNTADRSLAMIDYALRRRFSFYKMEPQFDSQGFRDYQASLGNDTFDTLIEQIKKLNKKIVADDSLGKGFCIGHSYFCNQEKCTEEQMDVWMKEVVEHDILPMLSEYWFDEETTLQEWQNSLRSVFND